MAGKIENYSPIIFVHFTIILTMQLYGRVLTILHSTSSTNSDGHVDSRHHGVGLQPFGLKQKKIVQVTIKLFYIIYFLSCDRH